MEARTNENVKKKTPLFQNQRKLLFKSQCPDVEMEFVVLNVDDGSIKRIKSKTTPKINQNYVNLYEVAYVKVKSTSWIIFQ